MTVIKTAGAVLLGTGFLALSVLGASAQEGVLMKNILGKMGIIPDEQPRIEYRERAPLVLPPKMDLRQPVAPNAAEARAPNWPKDPDVTAARNAAAEARVPVTETEARRMRGDNPNLSIDEIRAGRRAGAGLPNGPKPVYGDGGREEVWVKPDVLRSQGRVSEDEASGFATADFERRTLTQPPTALGRPTSAPMRNDFQPLDRKEREEADPQFYNSQRNARR